MAKEDEVLSLLLQQAAEVYKQVEALKNRDIDEKLAPEFLQRLEELKGFVEHFTEENRKVFDAGGKSVADLQKTVQNPSDQLEVRWQRLFDFSKNLRRELDRARMENALIAEASKKERHFDKGLADKDLIKKRQKRFKEMGGGKDWMRL